MSPILHTMIIIITIHHSTATEDSYLRYVKDGCFIKGEALSCVKYKALKIAKNTFFGTGHLNKTIKANHVISLVPLDEEIVKNLTQSENEILVTDSKSIISEWSQLANYFMKLVQEFIKMRGLKVNLPEGARTIEGQEENGRGKRKKLAIIVPLLTLLASVKTKLLLIPVLLSVMLIKKLLLIAALMLPSLLSTLKACKHPHHPMPHYSYFGSSDTSDFNSDYGSTYAYSSGGGYGKDWPSNRAYNMKHRPSPAPAFITAPGGLA